MIGQNSGPYEITALLGKGGMLSIVTPWQDLLEGR